MSSQLLTREEFKSQVFTRDSHRCVLCSSPAVDAHHIIERKLWPDGGYYLDNGASVCASCHLLCEETKVSCETLREKCGIRKVILPPHFDSSSRFDKWGNVYLSSGLRTPGELFFEEQVQKILSDSLHEFTHIIKYPRTYHLPWSPGATSDDKTLESVSQFEGREVVVTAKMDGENSSLYRDHIHSRSLSYTPHESRNLLKSLWSQIRYDIPDRWRVCGENLTAVHSIAYTNLSHFFQVFSIWNEWNVCLSWDDTVSCADMLGLRTVPVLYRGIWNENALKEIDVSSLDGDPCEGYVVRVASDFKYSEFRRLVGKFVRNNHVQTDQHWMRKAVTFNGWVEG